MESPDGPVSPRCACGCVNTFPTREAEKDLKRYLEKGPDATTRTLIEAIKGQGIEGATLLDVGGGIGAIQLELLAAGLGRAQSVDASEAYVSVARAEAARRGYSDRVEHRLGRLADLGDEVAQADIVTLDRVVCCDPDLRSMLDTVTARARRVVGLVYPRVTWWTRLFARAEAAVDWLTRDPTRWHLHPEEAIDGAFRRAGFERVEVDRTLVWQVVLYVARPAPEGAG